MRRLALFAALGACLAATATIAADARTTPEPSARAGVSRSPASVEQLNERENGTATISGCDYEYSGSVTGSPISNGDFSGILSAICETPGPCVQAEGFTILSDDIGQIDKLESGKLCLVDSGPGGVVLRFEGAYTIVDGAGVYRAARGAGAMAMSFTCSLSGSCSVTGTETSGPAEEGPIRKGNDPEHVLLCSPELVTRADGTIGNALQVPYADYAAWLAAPTTHPEIPKGSVPAKYGQDIGLTCDNLPGYTDSGKLVDETGALPQEGTSDEGAIYPYWVKT